MNAEIARSEKLERGSRLKYRLLLLGATFLYTALFIVGFQTNKLLAVCVTICLAICLGLLAKARDAHVEARLLKEQEKQQNAAPDMNTAGPIKGA